MIALVLALIAAVAGGDVLSRDSWKARKVLDQLEDFADGSDRFVDMGVVLHVVRQSDEGEELIPGAPKLEVIRTHKRGGIVDTRLSPIAFVGPSKEPVVWYVSEHLEELVLHGENLPDRLAVRGAMGAGKTEALSIWAPLRVIELTGRGCEIGATAPTTERSGMITNAIKNRVPASWYKWSERRQTFTFANGVKIKVVSTHQSSAAEGSPIQGFNWAAHVGDELQDSLRVESDIEARGRAAPDGRYRRFCTMTSKDCDSYRNYVAFMETSGKWGIYSAPGVDNPFVHARYWVDLRSTMSERDYRRKVLAQDVGPERQLYIGYHREVNVKPVPLLGSVDVTRAVLRTHGHIGDVLVGHDPGLTVNASILLKAYQVPNEKKHRWYVVGEVTSKNTTSEAHAVLLRKALVPFVGNEVKRALVICDPHTKREAGGSPHSSVYHIFRQAGFIIIPASAQGFVPKEARIEMVCGLLQSADKTTRLYFASDDRGQPLAKDLVRAIELSNRDVAGRPEQDRKGTESDLSHWPCALGYALWVFERPAIQSWGQHGVA